MILIVGIVVTLFRSTESVLTEKIEHNSIQTSLEKK